MPAHLIDADHLYELLSIAAGEAVTRQNIEDPRLLRNMFARWEAALGPELTPRLQNTHYLTAAKILELLDDIQARELGVLSRMSLTWQGSRAVRFREVATPYIMGIVKIAIVAVILILIMKSIASFLFRVGTRSVDPFADPTTWLMIAFIILQRTRSGRALVNHLLEQELFQDIWDPPQPLPRDYSARAVSRFATDMVTSVRSPYADWPSHLLDAQHQRQFHNLVYFAHEANTRAPLTSMGFTSVTRLPDVPARRELTTGFLALLCQYAQDKLVVSYTGEDTPLTDAASSSEPSPSGTGESQISVLPHIDSPMGDFNTIYQSLAHLLAHRMQPPALLSFKQEHVSFFQRQFGDQPIPEVPPHSIQSSRALSPAL